MSVVMCETPTTTTRSSSRLASKGATESQRPSSSTTATSTVEETASVATSSQHWVSPRNALVFLDWDDTLFPTTWIRHQAGFAAWMNRTGSAAEVFSTAADKAMMEDLDRTARAFVVAASFLGKVVCVTLAQEGWVERTMEAFYPRLRSAWKELGIEVRYASKEKSAGKQHLRVGQWVRSEQIEDIALVEEVRCRQKQRAMLKALRKFYGRGSYKNVISVGDGAFERRALQEIGFEHVNPISSRTGESKEFRVKTVKLAEDPSATHLCQELQVLQAWLPRMIGWWNDFDIDLGCEQNLDDFEAGWEEGL